MTPKWLVYAVGSAPAAQLFYAALTNQLGPDPVKVLENSLGEWALWFLIAGLLVSPFRRLAGLNLIKYRRALGVLAFVYVMLHFSVYLFLDRQLVWLEILTDIWKRPYITIGVASFLLLLPLAVTSNNWSIRKLGSESWRRLHMFVYLAAPLAALHYVLLVKTLSWEPLVYFGVVLGLVTMRPFMKPKRDRNVGRAVRKI